jgi:hypothetical protein
LRGGVDFPHAKNFSLQKSIQADGCGRVFAPSRGLETAPNFSPCALGLRVALKARREFIFQPALSSFPAKPGISPAGRCRAA